MENEYILIEWPDIQSLMEEPWFEEEAMLIVGYEDKTGSSAYFVPKKRIIENE